MASYISDWAGDFENPNLPGTGSIFAHDLAVATSWFNNTPDINWYSIQATSKYASGYFYSGGSFELYGSGFTTSYTPTVTHLNIKTPDLWTFEFYGNVKVNVKTGGESGYLNHIIIDSPTGENIDITGKVYTNKYDSTINSITYKFADGSIIAKGALTYHFLSETITGNFTSFKYVNHYSHSFQLSGLSIAYQQLDTYTYLNSFVTGAMSGNDLINGTIGNDALRGFDGDDTLNGGLGIDTLIGGLGNDNYIVDSLTDTIIEAFNEGTDTIQSSITFSLAMIDNIENLCLIGKKGINGTGNSLDNTITGNTASNILNGGDGIDILKGGSGNDTYAVDSITDTIIELRNQGTDTIQSSVTFSLVANVEKLILTGSSDIDGTGNSFNNIIIGNAGNNIINGSAGKDTLIGGTGNDTYYVDTIADVVMEALDAGTDTIITNLLTYSISKLTNIENIIYSGNSNSIITGNTLANSLTGNLGNDTLKGGLGNDVLTGGDGNDHFVFNK